MQKVNKILTILCGAFLLGMLWRMRGTHGWGAGWGLLASGFVFLLFLTAVLDRPREKAFPLLCLTAYAFMLTTPGWGTLLEQITGVLTVNSKTGDDTLQSFVSPLSGVVMMLFLGFGLASVFGVLCGHYFSGKTWRIADYLVLLIVFIAVGEVAKVSVSHVLLHWIEPQAGQLFAAGLQKEGIDGSVYSIYMRHYGSMAWAKKILGGRHYFASIETIAFMLQAIAVLLTARFFIKDRFAARTGLVVCGSFAFSITISDLFFFFSKGGYHMQQGFKLPDWIAAWSSWEYFTGFIAGGIITAFLLHMKQDDLSESKPDKIWNHLLFLDRDPLRKAACFLLCCIGGIGANVVRPILLRLDESKMQIPGTVLTGIAVLAITIILCRKYGTGFEKANLPRFCTWMCGAFVLWFLILYLFVGDAQVREYRYLHTILVLVSAVVMLIWFYAKMIRNPKSE